MWERQAKALASVEKTKADKEKWQSKFYSILEDFRFVPGGRIMHGAGREDITTTLNNCYVVAVKDDSIKSIYNTIIEEAMLVEDCIRNLYHFWSIGLTLSDRVEVYRIGGREIIITVRNLDLIFN